MKCGAAGVRSCETRPARRSRELAQTFRVFLFDHHHPTLRSVTSGPTQEKFKHQEQDPGTAKSFQPRQGMPPRSPEELKAIKAERLRRLYEAMGTPDPTKLENQAQQSQSKSTTSTGATTSSERPAGQSSASSSTARATPFPRSQMLMPLCTNVIGCPSLEAYHPRQENADLIRQLYFKREESLTQREREVLAEWRYGEHESDINCFLPLPTEQRINEVLRAASEPQLDLPIVKSTDHSRSPPETVYYEGRGNLNEAGRGCLARSGRPCQAQAFPRCQGPLATK